MKKKAWESISSLFSIKLNEDEKFLYSTIKETRHREKFLEIKRVLHVTCLYLSLPLYLFFWICDLVFSPENAELFLYFRLSIVPVGLLINFINHKVKTFLQAQWNALAFAFYNGLLITIMIYIMGDAANPYYAGLNLVAVGALSFAPWQKSLMWAPYVAVFAPYYSLYFIIDDQTNPRLFLTNSFFIVGTVTIATVVRLFNEKLRWEEVKSRVLLNNEIQSRNEVIDKKTKEAVSLTYLSRQFSPQVVSAIKSGEIKLDDQVHRSKICAIFIDIVNSTERVTRLDKDKVNKVISLFMEDTNKVLIKYDITIDKFLGDGILAFCNDPVPHNDFTVRVVNAALEIKERISQRQYLYENYWLNKLELCMGIAVGDANIGFYGSQKYYHSYTAIGPVINLASRLCGAAKPGQILMSYDVLEEINFNDYEIQPVGKLLLKGFESDIINAYELLRSNKEATSDLTDCPKCNNLMHLALNKDNQYVFSCRACGNVLDSLNSNTKTEDKDKIAS